MDHILDKAIVARNTMRLNVDKHNLRNVTYRNLHRADKTFKVGDVVLHSQKQAAVGPHKSIQPKYTGPFHIDSINTDDVTAVLINMATRRSIVAHFSNIQKLFHDPLFNRLPDNFDDHMLNLLPDKFSHSRYLAKAHADEERRQVSQPHRVQPEASDDPSTDDPAASDSLILDQPNDTQQAQQSTLSQGIELDDATQVIGPTQDVDPIQASPLAPGRYVTDTGTITIVRNDILDAVVTQPHDPTQDMRVDIDTKPTCSRRIRSVKIDNRKDPIEVRVITDPVEGMIEDIPKLVAARQAADDLKAQRKAERANKSKTSNTQSNTQSQQPATQSSQTRYQLRKRIGGTQNYTVWKVFEPP